MVWLVWCGSVGLIALCDVVFGFVCWCSVYDVLFCLCWGMLVWWCDCFVFVFSLLSFSDIVIVSC